MAEVNLQNELADMEDELEDVAREEQRMTYRRADLVKRIEKMKERIAEEEADTQ